MEELDLPDLSRTARSLSAAPAYYREMSAPLSFFLLNGKGFPVLSMVVPLHRGMREEGTFFWILGKGGSLPREREKFLTFPACRQPGRDRRFLVIEKPVFCLLTAEMIEVFLLL